MYGGRVDLTRLDQVLDLGDRDPACGCALRVEVGRGVAVHQVAVPVPLPGMHQCEVGPDPPLEDIGDTIELPSLLGRRHHRHPARGVVAPRQPAVGDLGTDPCRCIEGRYAHPSGPQPLGQRALRGQFHLELAREELAGELLVLPHVGGDCPANSLVLQQ